VKGMIVLSILVLLALVLVGMMSWSPVSQYDLASTQGASDFNASATEMAREGWCIPWPCKGEK
jgi:hypothetical protein